MAVPECYRFVIISGRARFLPPLLHATSPARWRETLFPYWRYPSGFLCRPVATAPRKRTWSPRRIGLFRSPNGTERGTGNGISLRYRRRNGVRTSRFFFSIPSSGRVLFRPSDRRVLTAAGQRHLTIKSKEYPIATSIVDESRFSGKAALRDPGCLGSSTASGDAFASPQGNRIIMLPPCRHDQGFFFMAII